MAPHVVDESEEELWRDVEASYNPAMFHVTQMFGSSTTGGPSTCGSSTQSRGPIVRAGRKGSEVRAQSGHHARAGQSKARLMKLKIPQGQSTRAPVVAVSNSRKEIMNTTVVEDSDMDIDESIDTDVSSPDISAPPAREPFLTLSSTPRVASRSWSWSPNTSSQSSPLGKKKTIDLSRPTYHISTSSSFSPSSPSNDVFDAGVPMKLLESPLQCSPSTSKCISKHVTPSPVAHTIATVGDSRRRIDRSTSTMLTDSTSMTMRNNVVHTYPPPPPPPPATTMRPATTSSDGASPSSTFANGSQNSAQPIIIAHNGEVQQLIDSLQIAWGVQYEIARGIGLGYWDWADITETKLRDLRGTNCEAAPKVPVVVLSRAQNNISSAGLSVWAELDREQDALCADPLRGLGLQGEWRGEPDWYGGRIQQLGRVVDLGEGRYGILLEKMQKLKSNRFARFLGSRRMLQVSIPDELTRETKIGGLRKFFENKFVICGRMFAPFGSKDGKVYMMEIREDYERQSSDALGDHTRLSPTSKWITRFDLGLSTSVPVLRLRGIDVDIFYIEDIVAPFDSSLGKAPTENIFTDGCGYMNGAALTLIGRRLGYSERPAVVQGRFAGSKGLWALHPHDRDPRDKPRIWIRPSQEKIKYGQLHPAQLIFDLVAPPRITTPSRLSMYTIMNLSHNGVPDEVFTTLMKDGLQKEIDALTTWAGPNSMPLLWNAVNIVGHVTMTQLRRRVSVGARVLGLGRARDRDDWQSEDTEDDLNVNPSDDGHLIFPGEPQSVHGAVLELLQAGFHPLELPILYEKLRQIVEKRIEEFIKEYRIVLENSAEAFIMPDPYGVLEEGQIQFIATQNLKDPLEDPMPMAITGEVLLYRNPARVPSDVRKVIAVVHPKLVEYVNVIVLPTKGKRSLANILAGGDVDGDVAVCIYEPSLVKPFRNGPINDPPPRFKENNFETEGSIERVCDFSDRLKSLPPAAAQSELQKVLLSGLSKAAVGTYSIFHENTAYTLGYDHLETLRLAFMFTTVLDSRKTGLKVIDRVQKNDRQSYDYARPLCMIPTDTTGSFDGLKRKMSRRSTVPFVLDKLLEEGRALQNGHLSFYDGLRSQLAKTNDPDLEKPFQRVQMLAQRASADQYNSISNEVALIQEHINEHFRQYQRLAVGSRSLTRASSSSSFGKKKAKPDKDRSYEDLAVNFARGPDPESIPLLSFSPNHLETVLASCAYTTIQNGKFPFSVAFRNLCKIKAEAGGSVAFTREFAEIMTISSSAARILSQASSE
ncbi:uncharacterized protein FIBRA_00052 [Fibroporia radiculosa]|uniref:RNA-dependent RNA polymerase n=1 Tax=Fibroporia radiculosa TaxID=599839 RepID=J7SCE9_9APHY|nr:uncharacterized protein FIBRA_00052 [Fibroporia radiculosa]CCL98058.1 predicted protein [Fibroporia radiculosa]